MNVRKLAWLALAALGCSSSGPTVIVDVVTDYSPGAEFQAVRSSIVGGPVMVTPATGSEGDQYLRARRVASFDSDLSAGEITVRVELLRPDGSVLATWNRTGTLTDILAVTAVFTRNCQGVRCNTGEVCIDEVCVNDSCDPTNPASCPDAVLCQNEDNCARPGLADCATASCIQFLCLVETDDATCSSGLYCDATAGCIGATSGDSSLDGGVDGSGGSDSSVDSGCLAGAPCDTGNPCEIGMLSCAGATPTCIAAADEANGTACGDASFSDWTPCGSFTGVCGNTGQRTRTETYPECQGGTCTPREAPGSEACSRDTSGTECSPTTCGGFSACGGFSDRCDLGGTQARTCTDHDCTGGTCGSANRNENQGCTRTLSETCGDLIDTDCDGTCDEGCRVAIHRGRRGVDHFYTRSQAELSAAGYTYEGISFYVYPGSHPGLVPLFRCRIGTDHFVTTSSTCENNTVEGMLGYVRRAAQPSCGSVVLYRLFRASGPDHFFTTSSAERNSAIPPYIAETDAAHVWPTQ